MIFGAVHDAALEGKVRVTVIATGFGEAPEDEETEEERPGRRRTQDVLRPDFPGPKLVKDEERNGREDGRDEGAGSEPEPRQVDGPKRRDQVEDLEIPTFIRRQMD